MKKIYALFFLYIFMFSYSFANADPVRDEDMVAELVSFEKLSQYEDLIDPDIGLGMMGNIPVMIEAVVSSVEKEESRSTVGMWINGESGAYYYETRMNSDVFFTNGKSVDSLAPGQKLSIVITPYYDGDFESRNIRSVSIIGTGINMKDIIPAELTTYEDYYDYDSSKRYKKRAEVIDVVIGDDYKVWFKGENGYVYDNRRLYISSEKGQRWYVGVKPYDGYLPLLGEIQSFSVEYSVLVEENVDVKPFEEAKKAADAQADLERRERWKAVMAEDPIEKHLLEPYDNSEFSEVPYKRILRNLSERAGSAIKVEGLYKQELDSENGLMVDNDGNYYHIHIMTWPVEIIDFTLLEDDKIIVYGYVEEEAYEYTSWSGKKTVPSILVKHIDLLEEE